MKFTIGTVSDFQDYDQDINLIKSSLLYADDIELIGLTEYAVFKYLPKVLDAEKDIDELINGLVPLIKSINLPNKDELLSQIEFVQTQLQIFAPALKKKKRRSSAEIQAQFKVKSIMRELKEKLSATTEQLIQSPSSLEIKQLIDKEIITIFDYHLSGIDMMEMTGSYLGSLLNSIYDTASFPLFDSASSSFIGTIAKTKLLDIGNLDAEIIR